MADAIFGGVPTVATLGGGKSNRLLSRSSKWWLKLPTQAHPLKFSLRKRIFGSMCDRGGHHLGLLSRLTYEWVWTDDQYYIRVDEELNEKGL